MGPAFDAGQSTIHRMSRVPLDSRDFPFLYMNKNPAFTMAGLTNAPYDPLHLMVLLFYDDNPVPLVLLMVSSRPDFPPQAQIQPLSGRIFSVSAQIAHFQERDKPRLFPWLFP